MTRPIRSLALFLALAAPLAVTTGCATHTDPGAEVLNPDDYIDITFASTEKGEPFLEFAQDGSYTGSDGCNGLGGTYQVDEDQLVLSPGMSTLIACPDIDTWVRNTKTVKLDGSSLVLFDKTGAELGTLEKS